MKNEYFLITIEFIAVIILLIKFIPKNRIREAYLVYFFKQIITWPIGLAVVELKLIDYPVRLFPYATKTSFTFEYFTYPAICAIFNLHYPEKKSPISQFMYYFYYCTALTIIEIIIEKYTDIIEYRRWNWFVTWITLFITFYLSRKFYLWFFKKTNKN